MNNRISRRAAMAAFGGAAAAIHAQAQVPEVSRAAVERNDESVERYLKAQASDGSVPDDFNLRSAGAAGGLVDTLTASFICPQSKFHSDREVLRRIGLTARFLERCQSPEGFV